VAGAVVAVIGVATAFFAATMGLVQPDLKRVLAYSTISQIGYMFLAIGVAGYSAAIFHLMTHAFFKALLFLAAGNVIHALIRPGEDLGEQDIRRMGGLHSKLPTTHWTMLIGALALVGMFPVSGFWSKDAILGDALLRNFWLYLFGLITAGLTAFYTFRLIYMTFRGRYRGPKELYNHAHEAPATSAELADGDHRRGRPDRHPGACRPGAGHRRLGDDPPRLARPSNRRRAGKAPGDSS